MGFFPKSVQTDPLPASRQAGIPRSLPAAGRGDFVPDTICNLPLREPASCKQSWVDFITFKKLILRSV